MATNDDGVAERVRRLRFHGSTDKVTYEEVGYNSRLDELQAALLRVLLPHLDGWCDGRRTSARLPMMSIEICCTEAREAFVRRGNTRCDLMRSSTQ